MNPYSPVTVSGNLTDTINTHVFLQQAVDHYPRLAAFSFTAQLPHSDTMPDKQALITRFHTEVGQRIGEYSRQRQQERRSSPPTLLRWVWESASTSQCRMVLLLNLDTLGTSRDEHTQQAMNDMLKEAWLTVTGVERNCVTNITPIILNRSGRGTFIAPFNHLKAQVQAMGQAVATARTGVINA